MSGFSERLSGLRREAGHSQRKVALDLGISQALLSHYENGAREPRLEFVSRVCTYYGVTADFILGRSDGEVTLKRCPDGADALIETIRDIFAALHEAGDGELTRLVLKYLVIPVENVRGLLRDPGVLYDPLRDAELKTIEAELVARARHDDIKSGKSGVL